MLGAGCSGDPAPDETQSSPPVLVAGALPARAAVPGDGAANLRDATEVIARRAGVRIVFDAAVRVDGPAPAGAVAASEPILTEAALRALLAGHELMFHYGFDPVSGGERLKAVWVFARAQLSAVRATASMEDAPASGSPAAPGAAPQAGQAGTHRGLYDADESVRLQALNDQVDAALDLQELWRLIETDPSEVLRIQALEAYVTHPDAKEDAVRALLDRLASQAPQALAEQARALRESHAESSALTELVPEPIDETTQQ